MKARSWRLWSRQDGSVCSPRFDNCGMPFASMVDEEIGMPAVERVELLLPAMLGRDAGVDGATQTRLAALGLHGDAASPVFGRAAVRASAVSWSAAPVALREPLLPGASAKGLHVRDSGAARTAAHDVNRPFLIARMD